jgi:predicted porin
MKKSLIALAVMAAAGAASAQSSVTLFGIVDASVSRFFQETRTIDGVRFPGTHNTVLSNSGYNSSRLGFRGTEDLGGGMSASFWLEGALANDNGNASGFTFQRRSTVSLAGSSWGELRLGRDYVPSFWNLTVFDPFGTNGVGSNLVHKVKLQNSTPRTVSGVAIPGMNFGSIDPKYVRSDNMIGYFLPANLGGVYGQVNYAFDEADVTGSDAGRYMGARVGFAQGPFNVALAYGRTDSTPVAGFNSLLGLTPAATPDVRNWNLGGQWDFGMAKLMGTYDRARYDGGAEGSATLKSWMIGTLVPVGAGEIRASYSRSKLDGGDGERAAQWAVGYVHNLSKRTALYATYARLTNRNFSFVPVGASLGGGAGVNGIPNGTGWAYDLGVRHSF